MHTQNQFIAILLAISFQNVNSFCVWHIVFYHYLGFTISFLDLGYPTEQEKPLTTSGSMVYSSSNPPNISTVTPQDHRMGRE